MIELSMISPIIHQRRPLILDIDHFVRLTTRLALPVQLLKVEFGHPKEAPNDPNQVICEFGSGAHS